MATNYYRSDGWVKTSLGPAIPGAQIYVCTQPANVNSAPPSPLADVFSDPNGLVPIVQPILTDGFGHYDFYSLPELYTLVVAYSGLIQAVYTDQSLGNIGTAGGGTSVVLEVNGATTSNQALLNLVAGAGISLTDLGNGSIEVSSSGSGLTLQTNGVSNTDQALLNLISGAGISLASNGSGGVTVTNTSTGTSFSTPGIGFFYGPGFTNPLSMISDIVTEEAMSDTLNLVYAVAFYLHESWTVRNCVWLGFNQSPGTGTGFGIYTLSGNALVTTYFDSGTVLNTPTLNTLTPTTLAAGTVYLFAWAVSSVTLIGPTMLIAPPSGGQEQYMFNFYNLGTLGAMVYAANPMSGNVMPSTLGALTNCLGTQSPNIPMCKFTP